MLADVTLHRLRQLAHASMVVSNREIWKSGKDCAMPSREAATECSPRSVGSRPENPHFLTSREAASRTQPRSGVRMQPTAQAGAHNCALRFALLVQHHKKTNSPVHVAAGLQTRPENPHFLTSRQAASEPSRGAATEYSPRRKPWEKKRKPFSPSGAKDNVSQRIRSSRDFSASSPTFSRSTAAFENPCMAHLGPKRASG